MDSSLLAQATTVILSPHLPTLLRGSRLAQSSDPTSQTVGTIWYRLYPRMSGRPAMMDAARAVAENPTEHAIGELKRQFETLFDENRHFANEIATLIANSLYASLLGLPVTEPLPVSPGQVVEQEASAVPGAQRVPPPRAVPACSVCGRQDETLQLVIYPYVYSVIVMTFRRAFTGLWCRRHANLYLILAGLITATVGWLGIPFGLIYTPMVLFTLARGGDRPAEHNTQMLAALAAHKLRNQDPHGAMRCLEAALKFGAHPGIENQLEQLYTAHPAAPARRVGRPFWAYIAAMLGAACLGVAVGVLDYLFTLFFSIALGEVGSIFLVILIWAPLVAMSFVAGLLLSQLIEGTLARTQTRQGALGISLGIIAAFLAAYGIPTGSVVGDLILNLPSYLASSTAIDVIFTIGALFTAGGSIVIGQTFEAGTIPDLIFLVILVAALGYFLLKGFDIASLTVDWQKRLAAIRQRATGSTPRAPVAGWLSIAGVVLGVAFLSFVFWPRYGYGDPEALEHAFEGLALLEQGETERAIAEFEEAIRIDPEGFVGHMGMGFALLEQDNCEGALAEFEVALDSAPQEAQAMVYDGVGRAYRCLEDIDRAIEEFLRAVELDPELSPARVDLGMAYSIRGEFDEAVEQFEAAVAADPEWSSAYAVLAHIYYLQDQTDLMEGALQQALALLADDAKDHYSLGMFYSSRHDDAAAEIYLEKASELLPNNLDILLGLADTYAMQGRYDLAMQTIDAAQEIDADSAGVYIARSNVYIEQEDLSRALEELLHALEIDPDNSDVHSSLSFVYFHQGQTSQALEAAQEALRLQPYYPSAHANLAFAYHAAGQFDQAIREAEEAIRLYPKHDTPHYVLGLCYMESGEDEKAISEFETFLALVWDRAYVRNFKVLAEGYLAQLLAKD